MQQWFAGKAMMRPCFVRQPFVRYALARYALVLPSTKGGLTT